ncbi:MAG: TonB-dependent receptor [Opitutus sp.]
MHSSYRFLPFIFAFASLARGQITSTTTTADEHESVIKLDSVVVSAGLGERTAFDLAQNTAIISSEELRQRSQGTLGETLSSTPGVNSTYYGPGASRPVIRGLGGDRVRVLTNSVGALDASNISPDHNAAIEPLFASRIEVLRGPATLLYGSSAVGGVVNVIDNSIPTFAGDGTLHGAFEARGFGAADESTGIAVLETGGPRFAMHVNALRQRMSDVDIPGVARIDADAPADQPVNTLPSSATKTWSGSVGATAFWAGGRIGAAISNYETVYGVPTGDDPPTSINMKQVRLDLTADITQPFGVFTGAKARLGLGDYNHAELSGGTQINTVFKNKAAEGRLELPLVPIGNLTGTFGIQGTRSDFSAVGEEVVTPPSLTQSGAIFVLQELKQGSVTWQAGLRYEGESIKLGEVDPDLPALPGYGARSNQNKEFGGGSGSFGAVWYLAPDWSLGTSLAFSERLPTAQELFSNGPHGGTGAYEVGSSSLESERSLGLDISLRKRAGFATGTLSVFSNRFQNFIFEQELPGGAIPEANNPDGLTPYQFIARDTQFYGAEAEVTLHLVDGQGYHLHLDLMSDYVHAEQTTDETPLPRIPPLRFGMGLHYENAAWNLGVEARHTQSQTRIATTETPTDGFTLLNANASYLIMRGRIVYEIFVRGTNLTNEEARVHASFLKDFAPLPGRGVVAGVRMTF